MAWAFSGVEGLGIFLSLFSAFLFLARELGRQQGCAIVYKRFFGFVAGAVGGLGYVIYA
jgi:hypothetical protein